MSDLLDQAIIDADALKEAAIKNAETTIIEKYSDDIKSAVEQLLEQAPPPEMMAGPPPEMMAGPPPGPPPGPENTAGMQYGHAVGAPEQEFRVDLGQLVAEMKMGELEASKAKIEKKYRQAQVKSRKRTEARNLLLYKSPH